MPEPTVSAPGGPPKGEKILGMNRQTVIIFGVALAAGLAWYFYKSRKSATAASTASGQGAATGSCTDANGNPTPCEEMAGIDYSGQLSTMQTELESILATSSIQPPAGPTGPAGPAGPTGAAGTVAAPAQVALYHAPMGLTGKKTASGTAQVSWSLAGQPSPPPTSYTVAAYQLNGVTAGQQTVTVPDQTGGTSGATISGLHPGWCYNINVWANGGTQAPPHSTTKVCV